MSATVERHVFQGERPEFDEPYYIVTCQPCLVALNSGHQYSDETRHHAYALAAQHNAEVHGREYAEPGKDQERGVGATGC
jgi:hypothetical protein